MYLLLQIAHRRELDLIITASYCLQLQVSLRALLKIQISSQHFVTRKKCFLTYHAYAAQPFFSRASFCLEL